MIKKMINNILNAKSKKRLFNSTFIISVPTRSNITNLLLSQLLDIVNPSLVGKIEFNNVPFAIVNHDNIHFPSIEIYSKSIRKKKFLFFIGNHIPKDVGSFSDFVVKLFRELKGKELVILNEIDTKDDKAMYLSVNKVGKKGDKHDNLDNLINHHKFHHIERGMISGFTAMMLRHGLPLTVLFIKRNSKKIFLTNMKLLSSFLNIRMNKNKMRINLINKNSKNHLNFLPIKGDKKRVIKPKEQKEQQRIRKHYSYIG